MPDKSSDYEKYKALEQLKSEIDSQIRNLEETADEKTIEKINKLKSRLDEETDNKTVDENLKYGTTDVNGVTNGPNYLQDCLRNGKYLTYFMLYDRFDA